MDYTYQQSRVTAILKFSSLVFYLDCPIQQGTEQYTLCCNDLTGVVAGLLMLEDIEPAESEEPTGDCCEICQTQKDVLFYQTDTTELFLCRKHLFRFPQNWHFN
ncbi:hypothetical protein ACQCVE_17290 [Metabacillus sp. 113a]|uniref:hypothetical protein n=1 Tax=Metabacillus sp. 113a TaxID=3404706 RepID=UPI003CFB42D6